METIKLITQIAIYGFIVVMIGHLIFSLLSKRKKKSDRPISQAEKELFEDLMKGGKIRLLAENHLKKQEDIPSGWGIYTEHGPFLQGGFATRKEAVAQATKLGMGKRSKYKKS